PSTFSQDLGRRFRRAADSRGVLCSGLESSKAGKRQQGTGIRTQGHNSQMRIVPDFFWRFALPENFAGELVEVVAPIVPCVEAAGLVDLSLDSGFVKQGDGRVGILKGDVVFARADPEELVGLA